MRPEVAEYILENFKTWPLMTLIRVREATVKRPDVTLSEIQEYASSNRIAYPSDIKFSEEVAAGGVGVRAIRYPKAGDCFKNHKHLYDHLTYLAKGSVIAHREDRPSKIFHAPRMIMTEANVHHQFVANEDDTHMMCLHRTDELEERGIPFKVVETDNVIEEKDNA